MYERKKERTHFRRTAEKAEADRFLPPKFKIGFCHIQYEELLDERSRYFAEKLSFLATKASFILVRLL